MSSTANGEVSKSYKMVALVDVTVQVKVAVVDGANRDVKELVRDPFPVVGAEFAKFPAQLEADLRTFETQLNAEPLARVLTRLFG